MSQAPELDAVLLFDWGNVKRMSWCPMPVRDGFTGTLGKTVRLGLLAGAWADGKVRVLDIQYEKKDPTRPLYFHIKAAAFSSRPPDTIFTSIAWLSTESLAAACANGCVAIWNLPSHLMGVSESGQTNPKPWYYEQLHSTTILDIVSCHPSRPYLIITSSMDGHLRLTDLRASHTDTVFSLRSRVGQAPLVWSESCQSALNPDENFAVRASPVRRFHATYTVAKAESLVVDLAVSPVHPFLLVGGANGDVMATNPFRRVLSSKAPVWQQVWFNHEWRGPVRSNVVQKAANGSESNGTTGAGAQRAQASPSADIFAQPLVRMSEGFKLETSRLLQQEGSAKNIEEGTVFTTIYEEKSAITCLAWNPNLRCGGWAAAGMGSGLVRVEDIALD